MARHYPYGELLTHVLGYVGRIDENDLARVDAGNYRATTHIGKIGIEREYEDRLLHGRSGMETVETNVEGRRDPDAGTQPPVHGADLVLSLDIQVQQAAWDALGDRPGAVVAIDPADGCRAGHGQQAGLRSQRSSSTASARPTTARSWNRRDGRCSTARCRGAMSPARR
jgi:cell division protein FtsI/penicillin-binding protein 2